MKSKLRWLTFRELGNDPDSISIHEAKGRLDPYLVNSIYDYLDSGVSVLAVMEEAYDLINPSNAEFLGNMSIRTDGQWIWVDIIKHYVKRYKCLVPAEFIDTARVRRAVAKGDVDEVAVYRWLRRHGGWR